MILINPGNTPIAYSDQGHVIGGGERRELDTPDEVGQGLLDSGHLIRVDEPEPDPDSKEAGKAARRTASPAK
jgi:hypothetical protein